MPRHKGSIVFSYSSLRCLPSSVTLSSIYQHSFKETSSPTHRGVMQLYGAKETCKVSYTPSVHDPWCKITLNICTTVCRILAAYFKLKCFKLILFLCKPFTFTSQGEMNKVRVSLQMWSSLHMIFTCFLP